MDEEEILEIVNSAGEVVGSALRSEVHGNPSMMHRVVHVLVVNTRGGILLQKRSSHKDVAPGKWDTSVGGHVGAGEDIFSSSVREMYEELGIENEFHVIGIAKKDETRGEICDKIYKPLRANPVNFGRENDILLFLQRIRDEAHRFAITFHRSRRGKKAIVSALDGIPGTGKKRKTLLLNNYGSITAIRDASVEDMARLDGMTRNAAQAVKDGLNS